MIGPDLEGAGLGSRVASRAASAVGDDAAADETRPARHRQLSVLQRMGPLEDHAVHTSRCRSSQEGGCSGIWRVRHRIRARSASACGRRAQRSSGYADVYLPVQGPCR